MFGRLMLTLTFFRESVSSSLSDSKLSYSQIEQAAVGHVYGDSTCGQRALYPIGMTGKLMENHREEAL